MRRAQKKQVEGFLALLDQVHEAIKKQLEVRNVEAVCSLLEECQQGMILLGNMIEQSEGEGFVTIPLLEEYCELAYRIHEQLTGSEAINAGQAYKSLRKLSVQIENSIKNDIKVRLEAVFLPYKASMWDSLESIWMAADADPDMDAYVIPIPYYDRNPDGSVKQYHYEADLMPDYVPVTNYEEYDFEENKPDVVYIHNPYDNYNYVTSVHPFFYSDNLKKYTDILVYVPYYSTAGGMGEGQALCPAYLYADYIVVQAEKYKKFFDPSIPQSKFLAFGSPKFDKVIRLCNNPPEPPEEWKEKMICADGSSKKVYFYNTSISGMLADTQAFLQKMEYIFQCFAGREDACLLWRPHPLLETTFDSMRKGYKAKFEKIKKRFIDENLGIYDTTPSIEETIAISDVYIGDCGTSVTSLFGVAGKPMFILGNYIHSLPTEIDICKESIRDFWIDGHDEWQVTSSNKLYYSRDHNYQYQYFCNLSEYASDSYYLRAMKANDKLFVCPANAQDIKIIDMKSRDKKIRTISFTKYVERSGAFCDAYQAGDYIFLLPFRYPYLIRIHTKSEKVDYVKYESDLFVRNVAGEWLIGGRCIHGDYLLLASPVDNRVEAFHIESLAHQEYRVGDDNSLGCLCMKAAEDEVFLMPYHGTSVRRWNPKTGKCKIYGDMPDQLKCTNRIYGNTCMEQPFGFPEVKKDYIILPPNWGNMFVKIDLASGTCTEWEPPFDVAYEDIDGYLKARYVGTFIRDGIYYDAIGRKIIEIDTDTQEYRCHDVRFDKEDVLLHESGFHVQSDWLQYGCYENAVNSLPDYLDGNLKGGEFDKEDQICAFTGINASSDGKCGESVHEFVKNSRRKLS